MKIFIYLFFILIELSPITCMAGKEQIASVEEIKIFFKSKGKQVVTFVGYSGAEYQDEAAMLSTAKSVLSKYNPINTIINIGGTEAGIGKVYKLAKKIGFETTGVVSILAQQYGGISKFVDYVFFVRDTGWGGFQKETKKLTNTSQAMVESSDIMIVIGGGQVGADEMTKARELKKEVYFYPADMNNVMNPNRILLLCKGANQ